MPKNSESLNRSLFDLLHSKGFDPTMLDTSGKEIPTPEEAEVFQFNFIKDGENYGKVTISIDGLHKLVIYFSDDIANSEKEDSHGEDESWYKVLNQLKRFAQKYQLSFELRNVDNLKHDMAKREYMKKKESIAEGYYPMGKKASYSDAVPNVKIVLQHTRQIEEGEQRYRNIAKIFLENSEGERFLAPTTKPGIARVYGRLIAEGDKPHGERWNHVISLVEEYQKMGAFVRATRNGQFNESAQRLVNEGINHYQSLRETLSKMTGHRGYNTYFESWTPSLMEDESEETNLNELFVQETLDPRIESVMPILSKLQKKVAEMKEVNELSEWADSLLEAPGAETLAHNQSTEKSNLKAFGLAEEDDLQEPAIDELEETHPAVRKIKKRLGQIAKQNPGTNPTNSGLGKTYDHWKNNMTYKQLVRKGMIDKDGNIDMVGYKDDEEEYYEGFGDAVKKVGSALKTGAKAVGKAIVGPDDDELLKKLQKDAGIPASAQHGKPNMGHSKDEERLEEDDVEESALQAYLGDKKYGKDGMDALRKAGREHASKEKMAKIRDKFDKLDEVGDTPAGLAAVQKVGKRADRALGDAGTGYSGSEIDNISKTYAARDRANSIVNRERIRANDKSSKNGEQMDEDEFAGDFKTGPAGQWRNKGPKANKPAKVGDLVGASESIESDNNIVEGQEELDAMLRLLGEGWKGELAGGTLGGVGGTVAGSALGALAGGPVGAAIGGVVGGAAGGTAGQMAGRELTKEEQLNEVGPLLAAGARAIIPLLSRIGPALGRMASTAGKAGADAAGKAATGIGKGTVDVAKSAAHSAAQNAGKVGVGVGAYQAITDVADKMVGGAGEVYHDVGKAAGAIAQSVGDAIDGKTIAELAGAAVKYSIPIGIILAVLYGGKKLIDQIMSEGADDSVAGLAGKVVGAAIPNPNDFASGFKKTFEGQDDLEAIKRLISK